MLILIMKFPVFKNKTSFCLIVFLKFSAVILVMVYFDVVW